MKRVKTMIGCLKAIIKKKIFNIEKSDISHDCRKALTFDLSGGELNNNDEAEEYLKNYTSTTRWQTV